MTVIGLTGGICSGKTTIARILEKHYDAYIINADKVAHDIILNGKPAFEKILEQFSDSILNPDGEIDRKRLGGLVFADDRLLIMLTEITHPYIREEMCQQMVAIQSSGDGYRYIVLDAPLLIEVKMHTLCDFVIVANAPEMLRIQRICLRDHTDEASAKGIISKQMPFESQKQYTDVGLCINTDCDMVELEERVIECMERIENKVTGL